MIYESYKRVGIQEPCQKQNAGGDGAGGDARDPNTHTIEECENKIMTTEIILIK